MSPRPQRKSTDWERVIVAPVMLVLLAWSVTGLFAGMNLPPSSTVAELLLGYRILLSAYYVMVVVLLLVRSAPTAGSERFAPKLAAYVGTFLPLLLPFAGGSEVRSAIAILAVALMAFGMAFAFYSLAWLGRSFGIKPQVRRLVRCGPYRFIRHPLYVGEIIALTGAVCFSPSLLKAGILLAMILVQAYRAVQEEHLLEMNVPEYAEYKEGTKRFVPGLF